MESMNFVDVYARGKRVAKTYIEDDHLWSHFDYRENVTAPRRVSPAQCLHPNEAGGFAYDTGRDEHWPIRFCPDCRWVHP
jgi:hypothetical protein